MHGTHEEAVVLRVAREQAVLPVPHLPHIWWLKYRTHRLGLPTAQAHPHPVCEEAAILWSANMNPIRRKSARAGWALIFVIAAGIFALVASLSGDSSSSMDATHSDLAPASFSGGCNAPPGSGKLTAAQLESYERVLSGVQGSVEAVFSSQWPGRCAIGVTVRQGDFTGSSTKTNRTEFAAPHILWQAGENVWYALSFELTSGSPLPRSGRWMIVDQFFAQDLAARISGGSPPLSIEITPTGQVRIHVRGGAKPSAAASAPRNSGYFISPATRGVWHDLLIHVLWSATANGLVEVWQRRSNGTFTRAPQVSAGGPNILTVSDDVLPVYAETGIYRSLSPTTQTVYYGGLWARANRAEAESFFSSNPS